MLEPSFLQMEQNIPVCLNAFRYLHIFARFIMLYKGISYQQAMRRKYLKMKIKTNYP